MVTTLDTLDKAEEVLMGRSFLYVHPVSFREGVEASMEAVRAILAKVDQEAGLPGEARGVPAKRARAPAVE
ncbi:MAG: hypothetical protein ACXVEY_11205 [Actinomycetota bacterium]